MSVLQLITSIKEGNKAKSELMQYIQNNYTSHYFTTSSRTDNLSIHDDRVEFSINLLDGVTYPGYGRQSVLISDLENPEKLRELAILNKDKNDAKYHLIGKQIEEVKTYAKTLGLDVEITDKSMSYSQGFSTRFYPVITLL